MRPVILQMHNQCHNFAYYAKTHKPVTVLFSAIFRKTLPDMLKACCSAYELRGRPLAHTKWDVDTVHAYMNFGLKLVTSRCAKGVVKIHV